MDSGIEVQRQTHEELDRLERALAYLLSQKSAQHRDSLVNEHRAKDILDRISERALTLASTYVDTDGFV